MYYLLNKNLILEKKILKTFVELNPFFKIIFKFSKIKIEATAGWESVDVCLRQMLLVTYKQNDNKCNDDPVCDPDRLSIGRTDIDGARPVRT